MKKMVFKIVSVLVVCISLIMVPNTSNTNDGLGNSLYVKNKVFVKTKYELGVSEATGKISIVTGIPSVDKLNKLFKVRKIERVFELNNGDVETYRKLEMSKIYVFWFDENIDSYNVVEGYSKDDNVEYSEPVFTGYAAGEKEKSDIMFPNDTYFSMQWYLYNKGNVSPSSGGVAKKGEDIDIIKGWDVEQGSEDLIVAILDSGIEDGSPDLKGRLWINKGEIPNNGIDDDGNGYVDDYKGWDFAYEDNTAGDGFGHGTNIATVIGANSNNSFGFAGINSKCRLMNCKNLSDGNSGEYEWWAKSIKYAVDNGAKVINMSEGGDEFSKVLKSAVDYAAMKNCVLVAAMMNKGDGRNYYPASYEGAFAVGATDTDGKRCRRFSWGGGSCWGKHIAVVAPGNKIYGVDYEDPYKFDTYWSGTSQSTAIVSGLSSLLFSQDKTRSAEDVKRIIKETAVDGVGDPSEDQKGFDVYYGYGRIDCFLALTYNDESTRKKIAEKYANTNQEETKVDVIYEDKTITKPNDDGGARAVKKKVNEKDIKVKNDPDKPARKK
jgi:thermitase